MFEEGNNFLYRNFFIFEVDFKWKFREASMFEFWLEFDRISFWTRDFYLYLVNNSIHGKEFEVQTKNFLTWI
jgi:hypothetical protein